jgi:hypothetical protein
MRRLDRAPHSGLGIASFVLALLNFGAALVVFAGLVAIVAAHPGGVPEDNPAQALLGLAMIATFGSALMGLGLGIGGACQRDRKKVLAYLGVAFNGMVLLGGSGIMCIGLLAG